MTPPKPVCPSCGQPLKGKVRKWVRCQSCGKRVQPSAPEEEHPEDALDDGERTEPDRAALEQQSGQGSADAKGLRRGTDSRHAQLPPEPSQPGGQPDGEREGQESSPESVKGPADDLIQGSGPPPDRITLLESVHPDRPSLIGRLSRATMEVAGRTTMMEIASVADRFVVATQTRVPRRLGLGLVVAAGASAMLALLVTAAFAIGSWRWLPKAFLFLAVVALLSAAGLRSLPTLAARLGDRVFPGRAAGWLTLAFGLVAGVSWPITMQVSEVTLRTGLVVWPVIEPHLPAAIPRPPAQPIARLPKPAIIERWKWHVWVSPGVLYMPPSFEPTEDGFDLLLHFHGSSELVEESVAAAQLNALVHITNRGDGSRPYQRLFTQPGAFEALIAKITSKADALGVSGLEPRRIAVSSWSAGYGAPLALLNDSAAVDRIDALLVLDGIHTGFVPERGRMVEVRGVEPFIRFAELAAEGRKLFLLTHSSIPTIEYCSSTESADAILEALGLAREPVDPSTSPPAPQFETAMRAFPRASPHWLQARSAAHKETFHVYGYAGNDKPAHIAHLAQMSESALPELVRRWAKPPEPPPTASASASAGAGATAPTSSATDQAGLPEPTASSGAAGAPPAGEDLYADDAD